MFISPNPATDYIKINMSNATYTSCIVTSNMGQVVINQPLVAGQTKITVGTLLAGIYYIRLTGDGDVHVERFLKE